MPTDFTTVIHIIGQILFGGYFAWQGLNHFQDHKNLTAYAGMNKVPMPGVAVFVTGALLTLGGLGVLFNTYTQISLILLAIFIIPTSIIMHNFWAKTDPNEKSSQKIAFMKNIALLGAMFLLF